MQITRARIPWFGQLPDGSIAAKRTAATWKLAIDFQHLLATGETLASGAIVTASVKFGEDATPSNILSGSAAISGTTVVQSVTAGVDGVQYLLVFSVTTSNAQVFAEGAYLLVSNA